MAEDSLDTADILQSTYVFVVRSAPLDGVTVEVGSDVLNVFVPVNAFVPAFVAYPLKSRVSPNGSRSVPFHT